MSATSILATMHQISAINENFPFQEILKLDSPNYKEPENKEGKRIRTMAPRFHISAGYEVHLVLLLVPDSSLAKWEG